MRQAVPRCPARSSGLTTTLWLPDSQYSTSQDQLPSFRAVAVGKSTLPPLTETGRR